MIPQTIVQSLNVASLLVILGCIFSLFTDRSLTVCIIFRWWKIRTRMVKAYFCVLSVVTLVRLAAYIVDFSRQGSPPFAVFFNMVIAFGLVCMTVKIYKKRALMRKKGLGDVNPAD